ncbi:toxin-antitoxin system YwqK family antitoxin [Flavobacterium nackdongense]|uniref:toxin-antitoxin system YwqK family antitoxin n=1 Tax=Flavobacterium nackdongense TaxID=2547394 RepID=UPI001D131B87|nr:toxin-antitoxin system YwqK family antitoxin [Flavobacterium nackdongense]
MKILPVIITLLSICSCSQKKSEEVVFFNHLVPKTYILLPSPTIQIKNDTVFVNNKKYSGFLYELQSNNKDTISIKGYYNGLETGVSKKWYADRKIMEERYYLDGKKNGTQIAFWENGNKKFEFKAINDIYEGEMKEWNVNGKLIHLANYKNGQEEGSQKLWYDNGKIRANYVIINGRRYGLLGTKNCRNVSDSIFIVK